MLAGVVAELGLDETTLDRAQGVDVVLGTPLTDQVTRRIKGALDHQPLALATDLAYRGEVIGGAQPALDLNRTVPLIVGSLVPSAVRGAALLDVELCVVLETLRELAASFRVSP